MKSKSVIEKNPQLDFMGNVYRQINAIQVNENDSIKSLFKKFYKLMEENGICQGNWSEKGRSICNPEWVICMRTFVSHIESKLLLTGLMNNPPKKLLAYGKQPKSN